VNDQDAVSLIDNPDAEDIQHNSYYCQSSTNVNVPSLIISNNQKYLSLLEIDDEIASWKYRD